MSIDEYQHGLWAEDRLESVCLWTFGVDLVARSPQLIEPSGPKEFSDILIDLGPEIVVFQSKSVMIEASDLDDIKSGRVSRKIDDAKRQLRTALNALTRKSTVTYENGIGIRTEIDWDLVKNVTGIVTLNMPDELYNDPEYRTSIPLAVDSFGDYEVHVFILRDFFLLARDYSTPQDLLSYLNDRKYAFNIKNIVVMNELDFVAFLKSYYDDFEKLKNGEGGTDMFYLSPGLWEHYCEDEVVNKAREVNIKDSMYFDRVLYELKTTIGYAVEQQTCSEEEAIKQYFTIVRALSNLKRVERREFSRMMISKYNNTRNNPFSYFLNVFPVQDISILFFASNDIDREAKQKILYAFCVNASKMVDTKNFLGIVTEGSKAPGFSLDIIFADTDYLREQEDGLSEMAWFKPIKKTEIVEWELDSSADCVE